MKQVIYVDVLLAVNLFVNYFLLLGTARFLSLAFLRRRLLLAAVLGAVYSLIIFLPEINWILSLLIKLLMAVSMVWLAFGRSNMRVFGKTVACFFVVNFGFAGIMFALWQIFSPPGLLMNNGVVYFDLSPLILVGSTLLCYGVLRLLHRFSSRPVPQELYCTVEIDCGEKHVTLRAKVDTGNSLTEPFSHLPVIVAEYAKVEALVGSREPEAWKLPCRLIPFYAVGSEGVLPAFHPQQVTVHHSHGIQKKDAYVAVCPDGTLGGIGGLMNPELLS